MSGQCECGEFIHEEHLFKVTIQKKWIVIEDRNRNRITLNIERSCRRKMNEQSIIA